MSRPAAYIERTLLLCFSCIYGVVVVMKMIVDTFKFGPSKVFGGVKRNKPPACLEDPSLGNHGFAHLENIRMHYVSNGAEDKPLMLLVHGFPEFWYSWRYQLREFKDSYRVVAMDLRGYGDSDKPSSISNYAVPQLVNDLKQLVTALGYTQCVLVGHDWGGALAWAFAEMYPDTISRLVILNCPNAIAFRKHLRGSFTQFKMSWYMLFFQLPFLPEFLFRFNDYDALNVIMKSKALGMKTENATPEDLEAYKYNFARNGFTGPMNFYRAALSLASLSHQGRDGLTGNRGITMPTLIVWGDPDAFLDKPLARMSSEACRAKVDIKYIEGASHWIQMDSPELVNKYIREFLSEE